MVRRPDDDDREDMGAIRAILERLEPKFDRLMDRVAEVERKQDVQTNRLAGIDSWIIHHRDSHTHEQRRFVSSLIAAIGALVTALASLAWTMLRP